MAEEKNKKKLEDDIKESENKSPDDFDKNNETDNSDMKKSEQKSPDDFEEEEDDEKEDLSGDRVEKAEDMAPDDYDDENEVEGDRIETAEQKSPDDFEESNDKSAGKNNKFSEKSAENRFRELEGNYQSLNDKYLRLYSEFDNFRKRTLKEKADLSKTASQYVIEDLLPVLDDFERAIKVKEESAKSKDTDEGFILIYNKLKNILKTKGLEEMDSEGKEFNTDYHDAITQIPAPSKNQKGKVVDVVEKGYLLNGKVIRYAKVVVGK